jgi:hypothetical protein
MGKEQKNVIENRQILFMRLQEVIRSFELWKRIFMRT